jgi:hypothetical protein
MGKEELLDDVMVDISGGTEAETRELAEYINAHGGSISCDSREMMVYDLTLWIKNHSREIGINTIVFGGGDNTPNVYGERVSKNPPYHDQEL